MVGLFRMVWNRAAAETARRSRPTSAAGPAPLRSRATRVEENAIVALRLSRRLSRYELYCWHRANGTLAIFFAMFGR
jgi:hypothetical protein